MTKWNVVFYETMEGECEVGDFLKTRKPSDRQKALCVKKEFLIRFPKREALNEILKTSPPRRTAK